MSSPDAMTVTPMQKISLRARGLFVSLIQDCRGNAATEFAVIVPLMLTMFFGTVEFSSGVAADRKVTLVARTLSDLTSQSTAVSDTDLANFQTTGKAILTPYPTALLSSTITELYVDATTLVARVQWSKGAMPRGTGTPVTIPAALKIAGTYLIYSEVNYTYVPAVGYLMAKSGITLSDSTYTRPRQSNCVMYNTTVCTTL
jgi:Flp pilus assembly protein TadG